MGGDRQRGQFEPAVSTAEVVEALNDLLQLEYDALGAYEVAIEEVRGTQACEQLTRFRRHHERHVEELTRVVQSLGGEPAIEPHATGPLRQALQGLGALGGVRGTLLAFRTNEVQVRSKYVDCVGRAARWPPSARRTVERHAVEEELHVRWVSAELEAGNAAGAGGEGRAWLGFMAGIAFGSWMGRLVR